MHFRYQRMREQVASEQALRLSAVTAAPASGSSTTPISQQYELGTVIASIIVANLMPSVITSVMLPTASRWVLADHFEHESRG